jgi:MFS family permease
MALGLAAIGGQVIGGALVEGNVAGLGWRSCFLINLPIGIAAALVAPRLVPESREATTRRLDLASAALLAAGLAALLIPLVEGQRYGWPLWTWLAFAVADALLAGFVADQRRLARRDTDPLVDLGMLRSRAFSAGLVAQLALGCAQASFFVYLALYLQDGRGLKPLGAGLVFTVVAAGYVAASGLAPGLLAKHGRAVVAAGGMAFAAGLGLLAVAIGSVGVGGSVLELLPGLLLAGVGIGLSYTPIQTIVMSSVSPSQGGAAAGVNATVTQVGYALGVAVTSVIYFAKASSGVAGAFELSLAQLAAMGLLLVVATRLLPRREVTTSERAASAVA